MEINENKTEINFYSLENFEYGDKKNNLMSLTLYDLKISSKEAHFEFEKHSKSFKVKFPVLYKDLIELLEPLKEEIKLIEKYETYTKEFNGHQNTRKKNYLPTSSWETYVNFCFSIDDINKLFYITDFKTFFNQNLNCELFIYLKKFNYIGESKNFDIKFSLFIFKNFNDEFDNLKFKNLILKVKINYLNLLQMLSFSLFKDKWFLNNKIYSKNIKIISNEIKSISEFLIENKNIFNYDCIWILLNLVSFRVITYYGLLKMLLNKSLKNFLKSYDKFYFILKTICLDVFKENIQDYKMNSDELFNYIEENFKKQLTIIRTKNEINNLIINNITCFIPFPSKELFFLNHSETNQKKDMKKNIIYLKFRGFNENENLNIRDKFTAAYIIRILKKGINNIYHFFGYSEYQFNHLSCYFIKNTNQLIPKGKLLDYKKQNIILFNPIINHFQIKNEKNIEKDSNSIKEIKERSNLNCNKISKNLLKKIIENIDSNTCYIIALYNGYYGIWSYINEPKDTIYFYSPNFSQKIQNNIFLYEISNPKKILFNYQFIRPLLKFIINNKIFNEIFENHINTLKYSFSFLKSDINWVEELIQFYSKIRPYKDKFILRLHESLYNLNYKILKEEGFLYIEKSYILRGVFDNGKHHSKLKPGYIYVKISPNNNPNDTKNFILKGKGLLFKYPNNYNDYKFQMIKFRKSYKTDFANVIVFSSDEKNLFKNLDISDLSTQQFLLIWDERIINNFNLNELNNNKYNNEGNDNNVTFDEIYKDFYYSNKYIQQSMIPKMKNENQIIFNLDKKINKYLKDLNLQLQLLKEGNINNNLFLDYKNLIHNFMNKKNRDLSNEQIFFLKTIIILTPLLVDFIDCLYKLLFRYNINNLEYLLVSNFNDTLITKNLVNLPNHFFGCLNQIINKLLQIIIPDKKFEKKNNYYNELFIYSCICYNLFYHYELIESIINSNTNIIENILEKEKEDINIQYNDFEYEIQSLGFDIINYYDNIESISYEKIFSKKINKRFFNNLLLLKSYIKDERICSIPYLIFGKYIFLLKNN